jgi:ElaB/YqjD/DUF883 family membrane-anchored ribosome-binding protein
MTTMTTEERLAMMRATQARLADLLVEARQAVQESADACQRSHARREQAMQAIDQSWMLRQTPWRAVGQSAAPVTAAAGSTSQAVSASNACDC